MCDFIHEVKRDGVVAFGVELDQFAVEFDELGEVCLSLLLFIGLLLAQN